ncbi:MAG TPA: phosphate acyltransferase, partial [Bacteroidales bacterium]|nr:phosphate acyltransferase [Bacteroidales bacterium]
MVLKNLSDLKSVVAGGPMRKLVLAAAQDQHSLGAVLRAWNDNIVEPILVGDKESIQNICATSNYNIDGLRIIHEPDTEMAVQMSVKMVNAKQADVLMKGKV